MRIAPLALAVVLAALSTAALAKNSDVAKDEDKSASSSCSAYQKGPDGAWVQLPCRETGAHGQAQTQHRAPTHGTDQEER